MAILNNSNAISTAGGYDINNSLRFRSSASAYLNRTPASAGNRKTFTWSAWVKRGALSSDYGIFSAGTNSSSLIDAFEFNSSNQIRLYSYNAGYLFQYVTTAVYRDPSAWYHIVVAVDTTQATATNRVKLYVNGQQVTAFSTQTNPTQNSDCNFFNAANLHAIGATYNDSRYFDGYQTDINFIDGQALTPSSFGETDTDTGSWKPKAYTGTYGTNGFYLKFSDIATTSGSNTGLGKDFSGNTNYWTTNNISVTAGTTYDAMIDSPTLTSATVANYCVFNAVNKSASALATVTNGNLNFSGGSAGYFAMVYGTIAPASGKWYWEVTMNASGETYIGISDPKIYPDDNLPGAGRNIGFGVEDGYAYNYNGNKQRNGTATAYGATYASGDIIGVAYDVDAGTLVFYKNNSSQGTAYTGISGGYYAPAVGGYTSNNVAINFGQRPFSYTPPTGYVRLNTYNLPDSTIKKGNTVMDATLWTGNSTSGRAITNAQAFKPDFVWIKARSLANSNDIFDTVRGASVRLISESTGAEATNSNTLASFTSTGFTLGTDSEVNASPYTYVGWQWQAGQGSNTSGTGTGGITSVTQSVNTTAGFSIVTYTGSGANGTVTHGLGVAPKMIIVKNRGSAVAWTAWHTSIANTQYLVLNTTAAVATGATWWNSTSPTSSVFSVGTSTSTNASTNTYVAYCWAEIAGYSKFGSYTGNGSADGPFVYLGFRPKFVLLYNTAGGDFWYILDSARDTYNATGLYLYPNSSNAEGDLRSTYPQDFLSNGFKVRNASFPNANGTNIIYMAFAENPFKNSNAR